MFTMAKVVMFPQKKKLPRVVEERLYEVAKEYVGTLKMAAILMDLERDKPSEEEFMQLVGIAFADGIVEAIENLDFES